MKMTMQGDRHAQPANCSDDLYTTLLACWNKDPALRPSFKDLATTLHGFSAPQVLPRRPDHESELAPLAYLSEDDQQVMDADGYLTPTQSRRSSLIPASSSFELQADGSGSQQGRGSAGSQGNVYRMSLSTASASASASATASASASASASAAASATATGGGNWGGSTDDAQAGPSTYDAKPVAGSDGGGEDAVYADFNMEANAPAPSTIARVSFATTPSPRVVGGKSGGAGDGSTAPGSITFI